MSYVGYGQSPYVQQPKVRFDAIGEAWGLVREKWPVWMATTFLYMVLSIGGILAIEFALAAAGLFPTPFSRTPSFQPGYIIGYIISNVVSLLITAFMTGGLFRMAIRQVRGEDIQIADLFSVGESYVSVIVAQLLQGFAIYFGCILCLVPGLYVMGRSMLALPIATIQNTGGAQAFGKSWDALKDEAWNAALFMFVLGLIMCLGALACGIGELLTFPIYLLSMALVYRDFFETELNSAEPRLNVPLPPSSAYGPGRAGDFPGSLPGQYPPPPPSPPAPPSTPGEMPRL